MKKVIIMILVFLLLVGNVMAVGRSDVNVMKAEIETRLFQPKITAQERVMVQEHLVPQGLENAQLRVSNSNATEKLMKNLERFREQNQYNFSKFEEVDVDEMENNLTRITSRHHVKFLFFNVNAVETIDFDETGIIKNQSRNIWERLAQIRLVK